METQNRIGVLLLNLGGPDSLEAVQPFLYNLFSDSDIIHFPLSKVSQKPLAWLISRMRSKEVVKRYEQIGGKSPILDITRKQASALEKKLNADFKVYVGMRYWHPFIEEAVHEIIKDGIKRLVVVSLYPQYSRATTGSSIKELKQVLAGIDAKLDVTYIESWYRHPAYLDALAENIEEGLARFPDRKPLVLFSAHNLPEKMIEEGDPYLEHLHATIEGIIKRLGKVSCQLAFQSKSGPVRWMEPSTDSVLDKLADEGKRGVLIVPISFVSDHIETLYEIDIMYRRKAESRGIRFQRTPSFNASPRFIDFLAQIVFDYLAGEEYLVK